RVVLVQVMRLALYFCLSWAVLTSRRIMGARFKVVLLRVGSEGKGKDNTKKPNVSRCSSSAARLTYTRLVGPIRLSGASESAQSTQVYYSCTRECPASLEVLSFSA
ncbi:uncharacterized protein B0H18DRAFT_996351, partial [Fomitopsis serialis]|uniref:uncharacterized protein n=1 Tax=Fomitopsis serialis TaxID=139415 RepID=UPI0020089119